MNNNNITTFDFNTNTIRVVEINGEPWFHATDVLRTLGLYTNAGATQWMASLRDDEKRRENKTTLSLTHGWANHAWLVSESGLYKLIMRSDKPQARQFQDWVTRVVLPSIRKDGGYVVGEEKVAAGEMSEDELVLKALEVLKRKVDRLRCENEAMIRELTEVTVAEYVALNHVYMTPSQRGRLTQLARKLAIESGIALQKVDRTVQVHGKYIKTAVNVYPRSLLDRAAAATGVVAEAGGTIRPVLVN